MKKNRQSISITKIISVNLINRAYRTLLMLFIVFLMTFSLFISSYIVKSLTKGINSTETRINADIVIVPGEYEGSVKDSLFRGEPVTAYFKKAWEDEVKNVEGVKNVTPQLFLATLSASCCDAAVQLIAFDPKSDFVIQPWINQNEIDYVDKYEIIVGSSLKYEVGDTAKFYGQTFQVAGKLEKTGMGYDQSAFISMDTAYELSETEIAKEYFNFNQEDKAVSALLIQTRSEVEIQDIARNIRKLLAGEDVLVYTTTEFVGDTKTTIANYGSFASFLVILLAITSILTLIGIFFITVNERQREFGVLASIGADRKLITYMITGEALAICIIGSITGIFFSEIVLYAMSGFLSIGFRLPFLQPTLTEQLLIGLKCTVLAVITGAVAGNLAAGKINYSQPYLMIKENNS